MGTKLVSSSPSPAPPPTAPIPGGGGGEGSLPSPTSVSRESAAAHGIPGNSGRNLLCPVSEDAPAATRSQEQLDGCLVAGLGGEG